MVTHDSDLSGRTVADSLERTTRLHNRSIFPSRETGSKAV